MGATASLLPVVPSPLELDLPAGVGSPNERLGSSVLPMAYRHLSSFPVLAKCARGPVKPHPNERITRFLREHAGVAGQIADFLSVADRLRFLHSHKVGLPPKHLKPLFFGGPSRELPFLYCAAPSASPSGSPTSTAAAASAAASASSSSFSSSSSGDGDGGLKLSPTSSPTLGPLVSSNSNGNGNDKQCPQFDVRYRGSCLARAVPLRVVADTLHRVVRRWLDQRLRGRDMEAILATVNKLLTVFRPTEEVWYALINGQAEDGTTLLTYAVAEARAPLPVLQQLLEIPCLDLGLPDRATAQSPIQLAYRLGRHDALAYFASLVGAAANAASAANAGSSTGSASTKR